MSKIISDLEITVIHGPGQISQLIRWLDEVAGPSKALGIDTETTGLDPRENRVRLIQVASKEAVLIVDLDGFRVGSQRCVNWEVPGLKGTSNYRSSSKHPQRKKLPRGRQYKELDINHCPVFMAKLVF